MGLSGRGLDSQATQQKGAANRDLLGHDHLQPVDLVRRQEDHAEVHGDVGHRVSNEELDAVKAVAGGSGQPDLAERPALEEGHHGDSYNPEDCYRSEHNASSSDKSGGEDAAVHGQDGHLHYHQQRAVETFDGK